MLQDEVVDGLKQAVAALRRERADIDGKIELLESTLEQLENPEKPGVDPREAEAPTPTKKKTSQPRTKAVSSKKKTTSAKKKSPSAKKKTSGSKKKASSGKKKTSSSSGSGG